MIALTAIVMSSTAVSCKKGPSDAELQTQASSVTSSVPGTTVEMKDGVAHLKGTFPDAASRDKMIADLKAIKGVKDVHDMSQIAAAMPSAAVTTTTAADPVIMQKVNDALKDYPSTKAEMVNGELVITGDVSQAQARQIKQSVDALNIGKVKYNYVVK